MNVLFRLDADHRIGIGHLERCSALAAVLRERGTRCLFAGNDPNGIIASRLASTGSFIALATSVGGRRDSATQRGDAESCRALLLDAGVERVDWAVVDHYGLDEAWETAAADWAGHILAIDDLADRAHGADILLDPGLRAHPWQDYGAHVPAGTRLLSGPRYALLRPEFQGLRRTRSRARHLFATFGGVDADNWTAPLLDALALLESATADIAVSSFHPALQELRARASRLGGVTLHVDHPRLSALMASASLAVGAGGGTSWERCACELPTIAWPVAPNQVGVLEALARAGALKLLDPRAASDPLGLATAIDDLLRDPDALARMAAVAGSLCDGNGAQRVTREMEAREMIVRPARVDDMTIVHDWRNHPSVRMTASNPAPIDIETHRGWYRGSLENPARVLLLAEQAGEPAGVLRYDLALAGNSAEVSIFLAPEWHGKGYGRALLALGEHWIARHWPITRLTARIRPDNARSQAMFGDAGYQREQDDVWIRRLSRRR